MCIPDHHPGYISFERYLANQERLRANWRPPRGEGGGAAREGRALLQGLIRCGRCGRRMQVGYSGKTLVPQLRVRARPPALRHQALPVGRRPADRAGRARPGLRGAAPGRDRGDAAGARARQRRPRTRASARPSSSSSARSIHADRARRQFDACEPENRLVARTLEREWEQRLGDVRRAEHALAEIAARRPDPLNGEEIEWCRQAGADLRAVFDAPTTNDRERKQLLRAILTDVIVTVDRESEHHHAQLRIVWEGGAATEHTVAAAAHRQPHALHRPGHDRARAPARRALPRQADRRDPRPPGTTHRHRQPVHRPPRRRTARLPQDPRRSRPTGRSRWRKWSRSPKPPASSASRPPPCTAGYAKGSSPASRSPPARPGRSGSPPNFATASASTRPTAGCRSPRPPRALGVARQTVLHKVQRGELAAVYVHRGKRKGLRIQVKPDQTGLFENTDREE